MELRLSLPPKTSSFIEELVKVKFKSTVICSKCNFQSSKFETDMMLSLPLPQLSNASKLVDIKSLNTSKQPTRRSLYANLILNNVQSINYITTLTQQQYQQQNSSPSTTATSFNQFNPSQRGNYNDFNSNLSKSKFYLPENGQILNKKSPFLHSTSFPRNESSDILTPPYHVKIGVNIHVSNDNSYARELSNLNNSMSANSTVVNPDFNDLRCYIKTTYKLEQSDLVFVDLNRTQTKLNDATSVKKIFYQDCGDNSSADKELFIVNDSICVVELNQIMDKSQVPLLNIVALNVYFVQKKHDSDENGKFNKKCICYGLPFALLINRDCSYSDLCKKLLESQSKYFKDKNILKYKV